MDFLDRVRSLEGRTVLVTGCLGYIGASLVEMYGDLGCKVIGIDRVLSGSRIREIRGKIDTFYQCDIGSVESRESMISQLLKQYQSIDVLINNAAFTGESLLSGWISEFESQSISSWESAMDVNLTAPFELIQKLLPALKNGNSPSIINVGSIYGSLGPDWRLYQNTNMGNPAAYAASKGGLIQLTRWLATTLAPEIRVNSISPGGIARSQNKLFVKRYIDRTPLRRMATEDDMLGAFFFLSSDLSSYVTGQDIVVDGGWSAW